MKPQSQGDVVTNTIKAESSGKCGKCGKNYYAGDEINVWQFCTGRDCTGKRFKYRAVVMGCPVCSKDDNVMMQGLHRNVAPVS